jgi:mono/diheme cytochrome c family protein
MAALSRRSQALLWTVAALVATTALVAVLVWEFRSRMPRPGMYVDGIPEKGAKLFYGDKHCGICHAVNGSGGRVAPDLSGQRPLSPAVGWLVTVLWNHQPGMWRQMRGGKADYPRLSQEEMAHILAFLYEAGSLDRPGDPDAGRRVFEEKGCARCHSAHSSGGNKAPDLSKVAASGGSTAWTGAMWNHAQSMIEPVTRELGKWPEFTGGQMRDLIAYASAGAPAADQKSAPRGDAQRGWRVFQKDCIQCHSVRGQGGDVGPSLGPEKDLPLSPAQLSGVMWNHAPAMLREVREKGIEPPKLQGEEIVDLLVFLASLRYFEPAGTPLLGERVFNERGCATCHGPKAMGTALGPKIRPRSTPLTSVSLATALWSHGPKMQARAEESGISWPVLVATDVGDLISFLNASAEEK